MKIVILGGGFCGIEVARRLQKYKKFDITLIDKKKYFDFNPGIHKILFEQKKIEKIRVPYKKFLYNCEIKTEKIEKVTPEKIITEKGEILFDFLVVSKGAEYPVFLENKKNVYKLNSSENAIKIEKNLRKSKRILIVGGGLIGTEVAGEILTKSNKEVTIVHSNKRLIERNTKNASFYAESFMKKNGCNIIYNEKVKWHENNYFKTDKGRKIEADICIWSTGLKWKNKILKDLKEATDKRNRILVNVYMQLKGHENIFAGGDVTGIKEEKNAHNAFVHGKLISKNIRRISENKNLIKYKKSSAPIVISLGDKKGILVWNNITIKGFFPAIIKKIIEKVALFRL